MSGVCLKNFIFFPLFGVRSLGPIDPSAPRRMARGEMTLYPAALCCGSADGDIEVAVEDDEIVVTKRGTAFLLAYRKSVEGPRLVLTRSWMSPNVFTPAISAFRAEAFAAANAKARELGWIV